CPISSARLSTLPMLAKVIGWLRARLPMLALYIPKGALGQSVIIFSAFCSIISFWRDSISILVSGQLVSASLHKLAITTDLPAPVGRTTHGLPLLLRPNHS